LLSHEIVLTDTSGTFGDRVRRLTQLLADELALGIARHPADWHMLGKMFIDDDAEATPTGQASAAPAVAGTPTERADDTQPAASTVASPGSG
jgi:KDO2-lipid IV(A) lauroyltransferase